jgi:hypothetical protein
VLVFAISVFFLVHSWIPGGAKGRAPNTRAAAGLQLPPNLEQLSDRDRVNALRGVLDQAGVKGEVIFIRYVPKEHRLVVPVTVPGRETTVDINLETRIATIEERSTGFWDAVVVLHKLPGPHGGDIRMNWVYLRIWRWLADATVFLVLFSSISGIYLWVVLRAERRIGLILTAAGAFSFLGGRLCPLSLNKPRPRKRDGDTSLIHSRSGIGRFTIISGSISCFSCGCFRSAGSC